MRRARKRNLRWLHVLTIVSIFLLAAKIIHSRLSTAHQFTFAIDQIASQQVRSNIINFVENNPRFKKLSPKEVADCLQEYFPCIKSVATHFLAPGVMHIEVSMLDPLFLLNQESVLTSQGSVFPSNEFITWRVKKLPNITVKNSNTENLSLALFQEWAQQVPQKVFKQYDICAHDTFHLVLQDKEQSYFSIVCDAQTVPTQKLLAQCARLQDELSQRGAFRDKGAKRWVADVRFDKQIILFADHEGGGIHG